jgi:hypothetical protein
MAKKKFGVLVNKSINTIDSWCNQSGYTMTVEGAYSVYVDLKQNETGVKKGVIYDIKGGRTWRFYSEQYNIEYRGTYQPSILYLLVIDCLNQDINSVQDIIEYHKLPDINDIRIYIENVRNNYMKQ